MAKSFLSISTKIISLVLIISVVSIAITTGLAFNLIDSLLKSQIQQTLEDESLEKGAAISSIIEARIKNLESLAQRELFQNSLISLPSGIDDVSFNRILAEYQSEISREITKFQQEEFNAGLYDLKIVNMLGKPIYSLNDNVKQPKTSTVRITSTQVEFIEGLDNGRLMKISVPILLEGGQIGSVIATTPTPVFDNILASRFNLPETGEIYLVNSKGLMISESVFFEGAMFNQRVNTLPISMCFDNNQSITGTVYPDYREVEIYGVSFCQKDLGFVLLTEVDESVVQQPIFDLQEKLLIIGLVIMVGAGIIAFVFSKKISKPILILRDSADQVSKGNFVESKIKTNDEIGQLSNSFDVMVRTIHETLSAITRREDIIKKQEDLLLKVSESQQECCICLADMVGAKKIMAKLSKEDQEKYIQIFLDKILPIVEKYNGVSVKMLDDSLLFYFNLDNKPDVYNDAIKCCLEICNLEPEINTTLEQEKLPGMSYRISSTAGTVNVTKSESGQTDIFGEPVNLCFKINQYSLPNSLVVGDNLYEKLKKTDYSFTNLKTSILPGVDYNLYIVSKKEK